jgi:PilZ domain
MDRREHHRVQLRLPARLRWTTPLGQKTEVCDTVNVSRGGLLVPCQEAHTEGMTLWITFPYDAAIPYGQPEISAKVVRSVAAGNVAEVTNGNSGASAVANTADVLRAPKTEIAPNLLIAVGASHSTSGQLGTVAALRFEIAPRRQLNGNGNGHQRELERRASARRRLAVPVRVRLEHVPWFEETMTMDISGEGLRFRSSREYSPGQFLVVSFESADTSPWPVATELLLIVVRIEREPQSPALHVAVCRSQQFSFRF